MRSNKDFRLQLDFISLVLFVFFRYLLKKRSLPNHFGALFFWRFNSFEEDKNKKTENEMA